MRHSNCRRMAHIHPFYTDPLELFINNNELGCTHTLTHTHNSWKSNKQKHPRRKRFKCLPWKVWEALIVTEQSIRNKRAIGQVLNPNDHLDGLLHKYIRVYVLLIHTYAIELTATFSYGVRVNRFRSNNQVKISFFFSHTIAKKGKPFAAIRTRIIRVYNFLTGPSSVCGKG